MANSYKPSKLKDNGKNQPDSVFENIPLPEINGLDTERGLFHCHSNADLFRKLLFRFRDQYRNFSYQLTNTFKDSDKQAHKRFVHTLKSAAANIGLMKISQLSAELENQLTTTENGLPNSSLIKELQSLLDATLPEIAIYQEEITKANLTISNKNLHFDSDAFKEALVILLNQIEGCDTASLEYAIQLLERTHIAESKALLKEVVDSLEEFDFEKALSLLTAMMAHQ